MKVSHRFVVVVALFVTCLITANIIAVKQIGVAGLTLPAAIIIFPLSYIIGDILTEVYGYRVARRVIWLGFLCNLIAVFAMAVGRYLPSAGFWQGNQAAYETIFGLVPRIVAGSFLAYLVGEFSNSFILAKMKIRTKGRFLWGRTIASTVIGQGLDSVIFILVAFAGVWSGHDLITSILAHWLVKTGYEAMATPLTYKIVNYLKRKEGIDTYDKDVNFNPLLITD